MIEIFSDMPSFNAERTSLLDFKSACTNISRPVSSDQVGVKELLPLEETHIQRGYVALEGLEAGGEGAGCIVHVVECLQADHDHRQLLRDSLQ